MKKENQIPRFTKMVFWLAVILLVYWILTSGFAKATTYYVKTDGHDTDAGTSWATAWTSISKVNSTLVGGDTVFFGTGVFRGRIAPASGGSSGDRTCYACSSFVQGICKIYGSTNLTTWDLYSGSIYHHSWTASAGKIESGIPYVLCQDDSMLHWYSSIDSVIVAGRYYATTTNIYAWLYNSSDPATCQMEGSDQPVVFLDRTKGNYTTFYGLTLRYGGFSIFDINNTGPKPNFILISHCNATRASASNGNNASSVYFQAGISDSSQVGHYNRVVACTLGYSIDHGGTGDSHHGNGVVTYCESHLYVESCYVRSPIKVGLELKNDLSGIRSSYNVFRFNKVDGQGGMTDWDCTGILAGWNYPWNDSVYGNILVNTGQSGMMVAAGHSTAAGDSIFIANNTIYNTQALQTIYGIEFAIDGGYKPIPDKRAFYNIFDNSNSNILQIYLPSGDLSITTIDSNLYYNTYSTPYYRWYESGTKTLSQWQALGFDAHSTEANPGFNNPTAGDFSRPSATQEMDLTYGGKHWTLYGAWQPGDTTTTPTPKRCLWRK